MRKWSIAIALAVAGACGMAETAHAGQCGWLATPPTDGDPFAENSGNDPMGNWHWEYALECRWWRIGAYIHGETLNWGFAPVAATHLAGTQVIIYRIATCERPVEDLELAGKCAFSAFASVDADEYVRVLGRHHVWAAKTKSMLRPGAGFAFQAKGGVEANCEALELGELSGSVEWAWGSAGIKVPLIWSTGTAVATSFSDHDAGSSGKSIETVTFEGQCDAAMDLDSYDTGLGLIDRSKLRIVVLATCDGACMVRTLLFNHSSY